MRVVGTRELSNRRPRRPQALSQPPQTKLILEHPYPSEQPSHGAEPQFWP